MKIFNILPPEKKEALRKKRLYRSVIRQEIFVFATLLFVGVLLGGVWGQLHYQYNQLRLADEKAHSERKEQEAAIALYERTFSDASKMLTIADTLLSEQKRRAWIFLLVNDILPKDINVDQIDVQDDVLTLEGVADSRESLLSVEQVFQGQACFSDASIPLSQLAEKEDITFKLTATIQADCPHDM